MIDRYEAILSRYAELNEALAQPEVLADPAAWQEKLKERALLQEQAETWLHYRQVQQEIQDARELSADPELGELARRDLDRLAAEQAELETRLRILLLPRDEADERSAVLEIRAGAGGEESCLFAAELARMYEHYAARRGFRFEPVSLAETDLGGLKEGVFSVTGRGVFSRLKYESGVHRVQRVPVTDTTGRKQTSTCTVAVLPEAGEVDVQLDPKDLRIETYRASGHGGQYVNRTDSAIRITHMPTGIVATCQDQKSQLKNKEQALRVLRSRILEKARSEADAEYAQSRRIQVGTGDRSERIRTYNFHEGRVTDHRIGLTLYRIQDIMDGDLDELIDALCAQDRSEQLRAFETGA